jgi:DNA-binding beta-propeller fold protein YncE
MSRWNGTRAAAAAIAIGMMTACGANGAATMPSPARSAAPDATKTRLLITIPHAASGTASATRRPAYLSSSTQSATLNVTPQGSTTSIGGFPQTDNLTPTSAGCTSTLANTECVLQLSVPPGSYDLTLTTYDQIGGLGNALSAAQSVPFTVAEGQANTVSLSLGGVPASALIVSTALAFAGSTATGFSMTTGTPASALVFAVDADGNIIVGPGAPTVTLTSSAPAQLTVTEPTASTPNVVGLMSHALTTPITLTATVTPIATSGASTVTTTAAVTPTPLSVFVLDDNSSPDAVLEYNASGNSVSSNGFPNAVSPGAMAYDTGNGLFYLANGNGTNQVLVYTTSGSQQTVSGSFGGLTNPVGIAYDSANGLLYVVNQNTSVVAFDQQGNTKTLSGAAFAGAGTPYSITYDPDDGFLYVTSYDASTVTAYDGSGNQQSLAGGAFSGLEQPTGIAYDVSNKHLYVTSETNGKVLAYDAQGNAQSLSGTFANLNDPFAIAFDPLSGFLYVANLGSSAVTAYDQNGNFQSLAGTFSGTSFPLGVTVAP